MGIQFGQQEAYAWRCPPWQTTQVRTILGGERTALTRPLGCTVRARPSRFGLPVSRRIQPYPRRSSHRRSSCDGYLELSPGLTLRPPGCGHDVGRWGAGREHWITHQAVGGSDRRQGAASAVAPTRASFGARHFMTACGHGPRPRVPEEPRAVWRRMSFNAERGCCRTMRR
jgi:hypothetical protein